MSYTTAFQAICIALITFTIATLFLPEIRWVLTGDYCAGIPNGWEFWSCP